MLRTLTAFALCVCAMAAAVSADEPGAVQVRVVTTAGAPVASARVTLLGSSAGSLYAAMTDATGVADFKRAPLGVFRVEVRADTYDAYRGTVEVRSGQLATVEVILESLQTIARVRSHSQRTAYRLNASDETAVRKYSPSLLEALGDLGGVQIAQINGVGALLSLRGQDPSATSYQINGVPLAGGGAGLAINTDLLSQASVDEVKDVVDFIYLNPTQNPAYTERISAGGFGAGFAKITAQGTSGGTGFAFAHTDRLQASILNGQTYRDLSGDIYRHDGHLDAIGTYGKLSAAAGDWIVGLQADSSTSATAPISTTLTAGIPTGYGPGERLNSVSNNQALSANTSLENGMGLGVSLSNWDARFSDDARTRRIFGLAFPSVTSDQTTGALAGVQLAIPSTYFQDRVTLTSQHTSSTDSQQLGSGVTTLAWYAASETDFTVDLSHQRSGGGSTDFGLAATSIPTAGTGLELSGTWHVKPAAADDLTFSATFGSKALSTESVQPPIVDVAAASYDCAGKTVSIGGPGDNVAHPTRTSVSTAWFHQQRRGSISILGYATRVSNALLTNALVPLSREPVGYIDPTVASALTAGWSTLGGCVGPPPDADRTLIIQNIAGLSALYVGGTLDLTRELSRASTVELTYTHTGARVVAADARLQGPFSAYVVGDQLPNVAPDALGITFDSVLGRRGTEMLLHYQWSSANNSRNLPAFGEYSFGFVRPISPSATLSIVATNLANSYAGAFASPLHAVGLPTTSGAIFPTLASPLRPAVLFVQFTFKQQPVPDQL